MDTVLLFLIAGVAIIILILHFEKKQTIKINTVLKETRGIPPLFLLKSTEQKINTIKAALSFDEAPINMAAAASMANIYNQSDNIRQTKVQELKALSAKYNNGLISLEIYNMKLDQLLEQLHSRGGFELAS
jgi:hypothetical protein